MKIVWYYPNLIDGSTQLDAGSIRTLAVAKAIANRKIPVYLASPKISKTIKVNEYLELIRLPKNPFGVITELNKLIRHKDITIVQERVDAGPTFYRGCGIFVARRNGVPSICEIHTPPFRWDEKIINYFTLLYCIQNADRIFIPDKKIASLIPVRRTECNKLVEIPNGFDDNIPQLNHSLLNKIRFDFPKDRKIIGYLGYLSKMKGVDIILNTISLDRNNEFIFLFAGDGPLKSEIRLIEKKYPKSIKFMGIIPHNEVYYYMKICNACLSIYPKKQGVVKAFDNPLKVYESLSVGTRVIISPNVNVPTDIRRLCKVVYPDPISICNSLKEEVSKEKMNKSELKKTLSRYTWRSIVDNILLPEYQQIYYKKNRDGT